jgi:hypothetical protein
MSTQINIDTKDLPLAAAAWKSPQIIGASVMAALAGCTFLLFFVVVAAQLSQNSPLFNQNVQMRQQYYKKCLLKFVERGVRVDSTEAHLNCTINADAYKAQLDARSR